MRVQQLQVPQVQAKPLSNAYQDIRSNPADFGAGVGAEMQQGGQQLQRSGELLTYHATKMQAEDNEAAAKEALAQLGDAERTLLFDPEKGFLAQKGRLAVDSYEPTRKALEDARNKIRSGLTNPAQQRLFAEHSQARMDRSLDAVARHTASERRGWLDGASEARITTAADDAITFYNDPERQRESVAVMRAEIHDMGRRNGWSEEMIASKLRDASSKTAAGTVQRIALTDPIAAEKYLRENIRHIDGKDALALEKLVKDGVLRRRSQGMADSIRASAGIGNLGSLEAAIEKRESGGRVDAVSPKGALGLWQLLPGTAKETAAKLGLPFDKDRLTTDPEYNRTLGKAYFNEQLGKYGHQTLALAAYNAGPGNVDAWLMRYGDFRTGAISEAEWIAKIPYQETREYVTAINASAPPSSLPRTSEESLGAQLEQAERIDDPDLREQTTQRLITEHGRDRAVRSAAERATRDEVWKIIMGDGVASVDQIPTDKWAALPGETQRAMMAHLEHKAKGKDAPPNPTVYMELSRMSIEQPDRFRELDLGAYASKLPNGDWKKFQDYQTQLNRKDVLAEEKSLQITKAMSISRNNLQATAKAQGIKPKAGDEKWEKFEAEYQSALLKEMDAFRAENKRLPKDEEIQGMADRLLLRGRLRDTGWVWDDQSVAFQKPAGKDFYVPWGEIPPDQRNAIAAELDKRGLPAGTKDVEAFYTRFRLAGNR